MNSYLIHEKKILLYGAATRGNILLDIFQRKGYQVAAFVDQRAQEIKTYCDLPVYTISELNTRISCKSDYAVYIDLKNVFEHDSVALELFNAGFKNLIFRPGRVLLGTGNEQELSLNDIYDILADEHADCLLYTSPGSSPRSPAQIQDLRHSFRVPVRYCPPYVQAAKKSAQCLCNYMLSIGTSICCLLYTS